MIHINQEIERLLKFGRAQGMLAEEDVVYTRNRLLAVLRLDTWEAAEVGEEKLESANPILDRILDWAVEHSVLSSNTVTERDILDAELMNVLMPRPSELIREFRKNYADSPEKATNRFYQLSNAANYIRADRIARNKQWKTVTPYGEIDMTINLSKPEKDPKEIAMQKDAPTPASVYPTCLLCVENEGYRGTWHHPARANHRVVPLTLQGESWFLQYSPYVYCNEHSIIFAGEHVPMKISKKTFARLLEFVERFPHYFLGSNADLPIVGGSILSHDHFQGGKYSFALERSEMEETIFLEAYPSVTVGIVRWPMSVLRVRGSQQEVLEVIEHIWRAWQTYSDESADILSHTGDTPHNTVTPIARRRDGLYEMDVVLRNNRTSEAHPDGIFHPHQELHHIKKENIGLIEVMGLAVLPGRLDNELTDLADALMARLPRGQLFGHLQKHGDWFQQMQETYTDADLTSRERVMSILQEEVGQKFLTVLEHAGVYKRTTEGKQAFLAFLEHVEKTVQGAG